MNNVTIFVPNQKMLDLVTEVVEEQNLNIHDIRCVDTANIVVEARSAIENGTTIIVARGLHASLIKKYTNVAVVELLLTTQELGLQIVAAKKILNKTYPTIAFVGLKNVFGDMTFFEQLFNIKLI